MGILLRTRRSDGTESMRTEMVASADALVCQALLSWCTSVFIHISRSLQYVQ